MPRYISPVGNLTKAIGHWAVKMDVFWALLEGDYMWYLIYLQMAQSVAGSVQPHGCSNKNLPVMLEKLMKL